MIFLDLCVDLKSKSLFQSKSHSNNWSNVNTLIKYPKLSAAVEALLLVFPGSYMVEAGFRHINAVLTR